MSTAADKQQRLNNHMSLLIVLGSVATGWFLLRHFGNVIRASRSAPLFDTGPMMTIIAALAATVLGVFIGTRYGEKAIRAHKPIGGWLWAAWAPLYLVVLTTHLITMV